MWLHFFFYALKFLPDKILWNMAKSVPENVMWGYLKIHTHAHNQNVIEV